MATSSSRGCHHNFPRGASMAWHWRHQRRPKVVADTRSLPRQPSRRSQMKKKNLLRQPRGSPSGSSLTHGSSTGTSTSKACHSSLQTSRASMSPRLTLDLRRRSEELRTCRTRPSGRRIRTSRSSEAKAGYSTRTSEIRTTYRPTQASHR